MNQNIEIEFKNLLTKKEYEQLISNFQLTEQDFFYQENHYFDTESFDLKTQKSALRIRKKGDHYELTLKQPHPDGLLETNIDLTAQEAQTIFQTGIIQHQEIKTLLEDGKIDVTKLKYFGSLETKRAEKTYGNGLLVFDHSFYLNTEDYELEYEVSNQKEGYNDFMDLLQKFNIPLRTTDNKIKRFYHRKYRDLEQK